MYAARDMVAAIAMGPVILGDKQKEEATVVFNKDCVVDVVAVGDNEVTGGDVLYEFKGPSPLKKGFSAGRGSTGCVASVHGV